MKCLICGGESAGEVCNQCIRLEKIIFQLLGIKADLVLNGKIAEWKLLFCLNMLNFILS